MNENFIENISKHAYDILKKDYKISVSNRVLILFDLDSKLSKIMKEGFSKACEKLANSFDLVDYNTTTAEDIFEDIDWNFKKDDIVVLIQSSSFRVTKFRLRNDLCSRGLKVVEFSHLKKVKEEEFQTFANSIEYQSDHYQRLSDELVERLGKCESITMISENGQEARYEGKMDFTVRNDGDYEGNNNYGSRYPIGEVLTEAIDLTCLNGELEVYAYPNTKQETQFDKPFTIKVENGFVVSHTGDSGFNEIYEMIKTEHPEGKVYVREFGLGLNKGIPRFSRIGDPIAYERQEGLHFSLGMKHGIYQKKLWPKYGKKFFQRYHIDVYINLEEMYFDQELIYTKEKGYVL